MTRALQRYLTDEHHHSEFSRGQLEARAYERAAKARWLHGTMLPSSWAEARELVRCKVTLTSRDEGAMVADLAATLERGQLALDTIKGEMQSTRGGMWHTHFPPLVPPAAAEASAAAVAAEGAPAATEAEAA